jgi:FkbM family methyltransferase
MKTEPIMPKVTQDIPLAPVAGARFIDVGLTAYGRAFEHPCKIRIVRWLVRRLAAGRIHVKHVGGAVVAVDPQDYIGWAVFKTGMYEPHSLALAMRIMNSEPGLFVDVGANFGWYTCAVASIVGSRVISIEPDCDNCASLRANVARNMLRNVIICNGAAGPAQALLPMSRRSKGNSGTAAVVSDQPLRDDAYWVAATPLDALLKTLMRPAARPVLLKMDIEGFEPQALAGLDFDRPFRPKNILTECDRTLGASAWGSPENFATFFTQRRYELFDVTGRPFAPDRTLPEENVWARDRNEAP